MSDLFDNILTETHIRQRMVSLKEGKQMTWEQIAVALYGILDDIDTADDVCKENTEAFRSMVMRLQAKKNEYMASADGQTVQRVNEARWKVFYKDPSQPGEMIQMKRSFLAPTENVAMKQGEILLRQEAGPDHEFEVMGAERDWGKAGLFDADSDYEGMLGEAVMELLDTFSNQGHSGMSAALTTELFSRLSSWKPLTPLTDSPDEWQSVEEAYGEGCSAPHMTYQSMRDPACFSDDGGKTYWSVDDDCFKEVDEDGSAWNTGGEERWKNRTIHTSEPHNPEK